MGHTIGGRTHSFHADASAFGGQLEQPFERIIPAQAPLTLSPDGGYSSARIDYFAVEGLFSFKSAYTQVAGIVSKKRPGWTTLATSVIEGLNIGHYDMRFAKPLDEELLHESLSKYAKIITVEDGTVTGGFGSAILEFANEHGYKNEIKILGIPDKIIEHGSPKELHLECGYDAQAIKQAVLEMMKGKIRVTLLG